MIVGSNTWPKNDTPDLCIVGHLSIDEVIAPDGVLHSHVGGAAYATTVGAALVTRKVGLVSRVGVDFPLTAPLFTRIDHQRIVRCLHGRTSRFFLDYVQSGTTRGFRGEIGVGAEITAEDIPPEWRNCSSVYISTMPPAQQLSIIGALRKQGCSHLSADLLEAYVRDEPLLSLAVAKSVDILFVNEFEWSLLQALGCERNGLSVVKRGAGGAELYQGQRLLSKGLPYPSNVIDPTNAGDVFAGAFLACLSRTLSYQEALSVALRAGAWCVGVRSPDELLQQHVSSDL